MNKLMKLCFVTSDQAYAETIRRTLKFVSCPEGISLALISPVSFEDEGDHSDMRECPEPVFHLIKDGRNRSEFVKKLKEIRPDLVIYSDLALVKELYPELEDKAIRLYIGENLSYIMLSAQTKLSCPWWDASGASLSRLETEEFPLLEISTSYTDSAAWSLATKPDHEALVTANSELAQYLCLTLAKTCRVVQLDQDKPSLNLNLALISGQYHPEVIHSLISTAFKIMLDGNVLNLKRLKAQDKASEKSSAYASFARDYDEYMAHVDYDLWIKLLMQWQKRYSGLKLKKILEIACGTANVSGLLVFDGFEVDACDSSWQMLQMADQKMFKPRLFRRSMTQKLPKQDYDLIICLFDSINYLQQDREISILLENAFDALKPNGLFIFDISTILNSRDNFADTFNLTHKNDDYMFHHAEYDEFTAKQKSHLYYFTKEHGFYNSEIERHVQRVYRHPEMIRLITKSRFELVAIHSVENPRNLLVKANTDIDEKYPRLFFVLKKGTLE